MKATQRLHEIREQLKQRRGELAYDLGRNADERLRIQQEMIRTEDALQEVDAEMSQITDFTGNR